MPWEARKLINVFLQDFHIYLCLSLNLPFLDTFSQLQKVQTSPSKNLFFTLIYNLKSKRPKTITYSRYFSISAFPALPKAFNSIVTDSIVSVIQTSIILNTIIHYHLGNIIFIHIFNRILIFRNFRC